MINDVDYDERNRMVIGEWIAKHVDID